MNIFRKRTTLRETLLEVEAKIREQNPEIEVELLGDLIDQVLADANGYALFFKIAIRRTRLTNRDRKSRKIINLIKSTYDGLK